ncbi:S41 family peptidase [Algibacter sp.]|uniref:S41 family peptidase n=1 Tax=Algibacter sp. TaxID=1872428 RepID=UPI003C796798
MKKLFLLFTLFLLFSSCKSVEKHNKQITKLHSVDDLRIDIDKLYGQLKRNHPKLYQYILKEDLDFKFDSLKNALNTPITSRELYKNLAPVLTLIGQGHIAVGSAGKRFTRKEQKVLKKNPFEFDNLDFDYVDDKLWVKRNFGKDSGLVGAQVVSFNGAEVKDLADTFKTRFASDGFNTTLHNRFVGKGFSRFYAKDHGLVDSLQVTFKNKDSIFLRHYKRIYKIEKGLETDSIQSKKAKPIKLSKAEKKENRLAKKKRRKDHRKFGFISKSNEYTRNFSFIGQDSSVAYMKIRSFSNGNYKKFYKESFRKLDSAKTKNFILDLRDNFGGRIPEVDHLYAYLTSESYVFIEPSEVNGRLPVIKFLLSNGNPALYRIVGALAIVEPFTLAWQYSKTKKVDGKLYFKMKYNKPRKPNELNYKGHMYVLTNGNSFSASSLISTHLKANERATFVGEETGGAHNGCVAGFYRIYKLPNSKLKVRMGLMQIEAPQKQEPDGYGVKPDVIISPNLTDVQSHIDTELEWILKDIHKQE